MSNYLRKVNYYETDKMGITHHSNYIRWMEEAKMDFLKGLGYGLTAMENDGVTSPVVSVEGQYKHTTTFEDEINIEVKVKAYNGVKLELGYVMTDTEKGDIVFTGRSVNCYVDDKGLPVSLKKRYPEFDGRLREIMKK